MKLSIGERREALGWTRYRLAKVAGVRPETVARLETRQHRNPHNSTLAQIERALVAGEDERKEAQSKDERDMIAPHVQAKE